jgi:hypothetical protein
MAVGTFGGAQLLKFKKGLYVTTAGLEVKRTQELVALGLVKLIQKFVANKMAAPPIVVAPHETRSLQDRVTELNQKAPPEEYGPNRNGETVGPYSWTLLLKLIDPTTLDRFAFITNSTGGGIAIGDLTDKIRIYRSLNPAHPDARPVVRCDLTNMVTKKFGVIQRPHFAVVRFLTSADGAALSSPTIAPASTPGIGGVSRPNPTLAQELADEIPWK